MNHFIEILLFPHTTRNAHNYVDGEKKGTSIGKKMSEDDLVLIVKPIGFFFIAFHDGYGMRFGHLVDVMLINFRVAFRFQFENRFVHSTLPKRFN